MIQQVGYDDEKDRVPLFQAGVGDGGSKMSLATAVFTQYYQPPLRVRGKSEGVFASKAQIGLPDRVKPNTFTVEVVESHAGELSDVAHAAQFRPAVLAQRLPVALTGHQTLKIRMAHRDIPHNETNPTAQRADFT